MSKPSTLRPLAAEDLARFLRNAAAAVARRDAAYFRAETRDSIGRIAFGALPLLGLALLGWRADQQLAFLVAGAWIAIAADLLRWLLLRRAVAREVARYNDDQHVWLVAEALYRRREGMRVELARSYSYGRGLLIDLLLGAIATAVLAGLWSAAGGVVLADALRGLASNTGLRWGLALVAAMEFAGVVGLWLRHRLTPDSAPAPKLGAGARGIGLLLLVGLMAFVGPISYSATAIVSAAGAGLVLVGLIGLVGVGLLRRETRWLRDYLRDPANAADA
jgi:hypothetical protein